MHDLLNQNLVDELFDTISFLNACQSPPPFLPLRLHLLTNPQTKTPGTKKNGQTARTITPRKKIYKQKKNGKKLPNNKTCMNITPLPPPTPLISHSTKKDKIAIQNFSNKIHQITTSRTTPPSDSSPHSQKHRQNPSDKNYKRLVRYHNQTSTHPVQLVFKYGFHLLFRALILIDNYIFTL